MITMLCSLRFASSIESLATANRIADPVAWATVAYTGTPACSPTICSCCTALGRCRSAATSMGVLPCLRSHKASLPASVVLPEPCRPASRITVGGTLLNRSRLASAAEDLDQFLVDDLDDLLGRVERLQDVGAERPAP